MCFFIETKATVLLVCCLGDTLLITMNNQAFLGF